MTSNVCFNVFFGNVLVMLCYVLIMFICLSTFDNVHASDLVIMCWIFAKLLGKCMLDDVMFGDIC